MWAEHAAWIEKYVAEQKGFVLGRCMEATAKMREAFPELKEVRGHVYTTWGKRSHVWLIDADGTIVDPTASQFRFIFQYEPWKPGDEVRVGKCMNCGSEIWRAVQSLTEDIITASSCSDECDDALTEAYATR